MRENGSVSFDRLINCPESNWSLAGIDAAVKRRLLELFYKAGKLYVRFVR